jgi:hypothetical protein
MSERFQAAPAAFAGLAAASDAAPAQGLSVSGGDEQGGSGARTRPCGTFAGTLHRA